MAKPKGVARILKRARREKSGLRPVLFVEPGSGQAADIGSREGTNEDCSGKSLHSMLHLRPILH